MMGLSPSEIFGVLSLILGIYASIIYIVSILKKQTRPHLYTFVIWAILTWIGFFAQLADHAGAGMWVMAWTAFSTSLTAILAIKYGTKDITKSDLIFLIMSLSSIIPWLLTKDPFLSVVMICFIDAVAIIPTIRKSWNDPWGENLQSFWFHNIKFLLSIAALSNFTFVTMAYPFAVIVVNTALILVCLYRRRTIAKPI